ncbi:helix-turn-helix domain-containing protein [Neptunicella sp. SCSIO 80796]|uniref:helix-turn-helix domain-containing protein n=1 Tax=Neptunicella plasticusilytica TaxID=3117012 RepID=UPI003A4D9555
MAPLKDWHRADIVAAIHKEGTTLRKLSIKHGYSVSAFGLALNRPYPKVEKIIANFLNATPQQIWPSRYTEDGQPIRGGKAKDLDTKSKANRKHQQKQIQGRND